MIDNELLSRLKHGNKWPYLLKENDSFISTKQEHFLAYWQEAYSS